MRANTKVKLGEILTQYRIECWVQDSEVYKQVTITKDGNVFVRGEKIGGEIGRKRQFVIDLEQYPNTLLFIRQTIWDGGVGIASKEVHGCIVTENFPMFSISEKVLPAYLNHFFKTFGFTQQLSQISTKGSAQQALHERDFLKIEIFLPDLPTQKRIVARLQALQALHREAAAKLARLQADVKRLRQSILQEAIQGKLVDYRPAPGEKTGAELLADIRAEKERRARAAGKKPEAPLPPVTPEEMPFDLPEGWVWCRLGEVGDFQRGHSKHRPRNDVRLFKNGEYPLVQTGDVSQSKRNGFLINSYSSQYNDFGLRQSKLWEKGSLCITIAANIAEVGILNIDACVPDSVVVFVPLSDFNVRFLLYYFLVFRERIEQYAPATAQKNINLGIIEGLIFPLPSFEMQTKIVELVEKKIGGCSEMYQQLTVLQNTVVSLWKSELQQTFKFESNG